jgi:ABC-type transport system involved in cytochrome c biogenesis ATPase subunit
VIGAVRGAEPTGGARWLGWLIAPSARPGSLGLVIHAQGVTVGRGRRVLMTGLDLEIGAGELVHIAGPNGCGKSSLLRVLAGVVEPRRGRVTRDAPCNFVPERVALPGGLRAGRWLWLSGAHGVPVPAGLDRACGGLSKGELQKVALAGALHEARERPVVLALDEPWAGLDADARCDLGAQLAAAAAQGSAVVFTDHSRAATVQATRTVSLGGELPAPDTADARIVLVRGGERAAVVVRDPRLAARLADGWKISDAELLR